MAVTLSAGAAGADGGARLACRPCHPGCVTCQDDAPCLIQEDRALRAAVLSCQAGCMLAVFLSMLVSYHFRRSKASCPRIPAPTRPKPHPSPVRSGVSLPGLHRPGCTLTPLSPQRIRASGVVLLETILFGSLLLYFPVSNRPSPGLENSGWGLGVFAAWLPPRQGHRAGPTLRTGTAPPNC